MSIRCPDFTYISIRITVTNRISQITDFMHISTGWGKMPTVPAGQRKLSSGVKNKKILQRYQGYVMSVSHKATKTIHELIDDDTRICLQLDDSTFLCEMLEGLKCCPSAHM